MIQHARSPERVSALVPAALAAVAAATTSPTELPREREATCSCSASFTQYRVSPSSAEYAPDVCLDCVRAQGAAVARVATAEDLERERARRLAVLDVPLLYRSVTLESFEFHGAAGDSAKQERAIRAARRYLAEWPHRHEDDGTGFQMLSILRGATGSGKTHVSWAIAKHVRVAYGDSVLFTTLADMMGDLRTAWNQGRGEGPSEHQRLRAYRDPELLVIDDVTRGTFMGEPEAHLYQVLSHREQRGRPTIVTSNEDEAELARLLGAPMVSRVSAWGGMWDFGDSDYRPQLGQARRLARRAAR